MSLPRLAAVVALALVSVAVAGDEPAPLKFAWPIPSKATVTEKILRAGHGATTRYTITLEASGTSGDLRLHIGDFEFLDIDGKPASDPAVAAQIKASLPMSKALPDLLIGADGAVKDVLGLERTISTMIEEVRKDADGPQKAALLAQMETPAIQKEIRRGTSKHWVAWVSEWAGRTIPEGKGVEGTHTVVCPDTTEIAAPTQYRRMSGESDGPGLVKLTRESVLDGEDSKAAFDSWIEKSNLPPERRIPATGMRVIDRVVAVTEPATLRPKWVRREEQLVLHMKDGSDRAAVERHQYDFEWAAAAAAPKAPESGK